MTKANVMPELQRDSDGEKSYRLNARNPVAADAHMSVAKVKRRSPGQSHNVVKAVKSVL